MTGSTWGQVIASILWTRRGPADRVFDYSLYLWYVIGRIGLMSRLKIKYPSISAVITAAAPKYLAAVKVTDKDQPVRLWDVEVFTIGLLDGKHKVPAEPLCDRTGRSNHPDALRISVFTPGEAGSWFPSNTGRALKNALNAVQ